MFPSYNSNMLTYALDTVLRSNVSAFDYYTSLDTIRQEELNQISREFSSREELERYIVHAMNNRDDVIS